MSNLSDAFKLEFPDDVQRIRQAIPLLEDYSNTEIAMLWERFSDREYCAGWMLVSDELLKRFEQWLND